MSELNQSGKAVLSVSIDHHALVSQLARFSAEHPGALQDAHQTMFSDVAIIISPVQLAQMKAVIQAVENVVALPNWQQHVLGDSYQKYTPANQGVFFGYDFHLNEDGAHLIEINTNAGGGFLSGLFEQSQYDIALPGKSLASDNLEQVFVEMFRNEWYLQRGTVPLRTIAIIDESPQSQYFYPEFVLASEMFERAGIQTLIVDPDELKSDDDGLYLGEVKIDLVYNRLTDFSLETFPALLSVYQKNQVVVTPHPHAYTLYADKRNLCLLTNADFLRSIGSDETTISILHDGIPLTRLVEETDSEQWWKDRKEWFFKPATGYGGRGSYRGDKLTKGVFGEIMQGGYVAQRKAMPGEVSVSVAAAEPATFKYDVRCYVYEGQLQMVVARMYQGQTTNFRTPGGGFALVREADLR